jgi:CRP/FNR family transcriptional regulator
MCPVFSDLDWARMQALGASTVRRGYVRGETIYFAGDTPLGLCCLLEGKVKIVKSNADGKDQIVRIASAGDILGYRALICGEGHNTTAVALGTVQICYIPKSEFLTLLETDQTLQVRIMRLLSEELRAAEDRLVTMAQKNLHQRVAETLLFLHQTFGFQADGKTLDIPLRRNDIADLVGSAVESVSRVLSNFNQTGIIGIRGRKIEILQTRGLRKEASLVN